MDIKIEYLADHPKIIPLLAGWFNEEWGKSDSLNSIEAFKAQLEGGLNRDQPPITFVGFSGEEPLATATLKVQEMEIRPGYEHWLGSVYVRENYRHMGIATSLIRGVIQEAKKHGIKVLFLYTRTKIDLYTKLGWEVIETVTYRGKVVSIMQRIQGKEE